MRCLSCKARANQRDKPSYYCPDNHVNLFIEGFQVQILLHDDGSSRFQSRKESQG